MNVFSAVGNIGGKNAIVRFTPNNDAITEFSLAVQTGFGDKAVTTWFNCAYWGKRGQSVADYLTKGKQIYIIGELTNRKYVDKQGVEKYSLDLRVSDVKLLGSKDDSNTASAQNNVPSNAPIGSFEDMADDDIPF
jgi:single-strand DNA-binding protein